ncbi:MAG: dehypoxanthine futalosine cyclase [Bacteroidetes bacterium]|nr:dehypoxanthine futalosine cyclase [Bacteroidota bacterium]
MNTSQLINNALSREFLTLEEGLHLYSALSLPELMAIANNIRFQLHPEPKVTWIIDRNVNYTNVCSSGCQFCNFYRSVNSKEAYITNIDEYKCKIDEMLKLGGDQLLLQGGMHPRLGLQFYVDLFSSLKQHYPGVKLHALGPPEIVHISKLENISYEACLKALIESGLDSLPGAGAEILSDNVRSKISKNKCTVGEWLDVMRQAHKLNLVTSATMMFGHIETIAERLQHLIYIRDVQKEKPENSPGFVSFIPWPFQDKDTVLLKQYGIKNKVTAAEYIRMIAISRILLPNIPNIQASWLTVGATTGQICLHAGANDFGSIMIEENVVSVAGADYKFDANGIQKAITEAGFQPQRRNQRFEEVEG